MTSSTWIRKTQLPDLGTRKGVSLEDVSKDSSWMNGFDWMKQESSAFPIKSKTNIMLTQDDVEACSKESSIPEKPATNQFVVTRILLYLTKYRSGINILHT